MTTRTLFDSLAELFARDVDSALVERALARTPTERIEWLEDLQQLAEEARKARRAAEEATNARRKAALRAMNAILILCRALAYEGKSDDLAVILDVAEYLPLLMLEDADRSESFREQLVDLVRRYPRFALALERFDA